jgi:hypothetical protein
VREWLEGQPRITALRSDSRSHFGEDYRQDTRMQSDTPHAMSQGSSEQGSLEEGAGVWGCFWVEVAAVAELAAGWGCLLAERLQQ